MLFNPVLFWFVLIAHFTTYGGRQMPLVTEPPQPSNPAPGYGDFNGDGITDTAFFVPASVDTLPILITDGPDPWRFYLRFSDSTLDSIPVHYTYDLHSAPDVNGDGADELLLVQRLAGYYRVMSFDNTGQRWNQLLAVSSPLAHYQPADWIYSRNDTLFFYTNPSHPDRVFKDRWESVKM
jgi:hypothetical protein